MRRKELTLAERTQILTRSRRNARESFFLEFSKHIRSWLHELTREYKEASVFPFTPEWLLASYYNDAQDKEVAAFVGMKGARRTEEGKMLADVGELRKILGESPRKWFVSRTFAHLSRTDIKEISLETARLENVVQAMDALWGRCKVEKDGVVLIRGIEETLKDEAGKNNRTLKAELNEWLHYTPAEMSFKIPVLFMVLGTNDGIGQGAWDIPVDERRCPINKEVLAFLKTWIPDYRKFGKADDAIHLFGFEKDCDFLYACWAWNDLKSRRMDECKYLVKRYSKWYEIGIGKHKCHWDEVLFDI